MNHWAITVGINHYQRFQPLSFAEPDAQAMRNFLVEEAGFAPDRCLLLTDTSPPIWGKPTYPTRENIQSWIERLSQQYLQPGDMLWYFFSGYGVCYQGTDYLMPIEGEPGAIAQTGISMTAVYDCLKALPTEALLVLLDMNRSQGVISQEFVGIQTKQLASHAKIPTILSCKPEQFSREAAALGHGFFTTALLESLRTSNTATVDSLNRYLQNRLPELSEHHWRPLQQPVIISPAEKAHQLLLPTMNGGAPIWSGKQETIALPNPPGDRLPDPWARDPATASTEATMQPAHSRPLTPMPNQVGVSNRHFNGNSAKPMTFSQPNSGTNLPPQPLVSPASQPFSDEELADATFGRQLLLWGGIGAALLFLSVLLKNWSVLFPSAPPQSVISTVTAAPSPSTQVGTTTPNEPPNNTSQNPPSIANNLSDQSQSGDRNGAVKPTTPPPPNTPSMLAIARAKIKSELATPYRSAIQTAQTVPQGNPEYQQAQQEIAIWSGEIWAIAQRRSNQGEVGAAIWAASLIPPNQAIAKAARPQLAEWCRRLKTRPNVNGLPETKARPICQNLAKQ